MDSITYNPYRIIGILADASERNLQQRKGNILALNRINKPIDSEYDFSFLKPIQRDSKTIDKALSDIEHAQDKVIHALFWFINTTTIDNTALQYLMNGNTKKAINMWENIVRADITPISNTFEGTTTMSDEEYKLNPDVPSRFNRETADKAEIKKELIELSKDILNNLEKELGRKPTLEDFLNYFVERFGKSNVESKFNSFVKLAEELGLDISKANQYYDATFDKKSGIANTLELDEDIENAQNPKAQLKDITLKNFSAFNNLGTIYLTDKNKRKIGIEIKLKLIESSFFKDFTAKVADETFTINTQKMVEIFVDRAINSLYKENYSSIQILSLFRNTGTAENYITEKLTEEPIHKIEKAVENSKEQRTKDKTNAYNIGNRLYNDTQITLNELKQILGVNHLKYQTMADSVAKELKQCATDNWINSDKGDTTLERSIGLIKLAHKLAVGKGLKENIQKDIRALGSLKDKELNIAVEVLKQIRQAYNDVPIGHSLNWHAIVELIEECIPKQNIDKIKKSTNAQKLEEYKTLVDFIIDRADYVWRLKYLRFWQATIPRASSISKPQTSTRAPSLKPTNEGKAFDVVILRIAAIIIFFMVAVKMCSSNERPNNYSEKHMPYKQREVQSIESSEESIEEEKSYNTYRNTYDDLNYSQETEENTEDEEEEYYDTYEKTYDDSFYQETEEDN